MSSSSASALPLAEPSSLQDSSPGTLLQNFDAVGSRDSAVTNFGAEFEPPDQGLCVGNGFVLEPVNSAFLIYHRDGSKVLGPLNVNVLFDEGLKQLISDPRCYFDAPTHTWFAVVLFLNSAGTAARTDIAVSQSGDPTRPWTIYHLDATDDGTHNTPSHAGCPCLGDQPLLGLDGQNLYISTNEFSILGLQFNGAQIYAIAKSELISARPAHFVHFANLNVGGSVATSVQPAISSSVTPAEYFLSSLDPNGTTDNRIGVWALTNPEKVVEGKVPTLSDLVISTETYGVPPKADQKGSTSQLDSGDDRMQQVQLIQGNLWGSLGTVVTLRNDPTPRAGVAWFKIHPSLKGAQIGSAELLTQGYVASTGNFLLYPAIEASPTGTVTIDMTLSGSTFYPSVADTVMTGEYIPPLASQTSDGRRNWGTRVLEVQP